MLSPNRKFVRIANAVSIYEQLRGKTSNLYDRLAFLEGFESPLSEEQSESLTKEIHSALKRIMGPYADDIIRANITEMNASLIHELGHILTDPTYILEGLTEEVGLQTGKTKIEEDLDEFVNMLLTGEVNIDNIWKEDSYTKSMSEIMDDLEHHITGGFQKRKYLAQLARNFRRLHPELMDRIPAKEFRRHRKIIHKLKSSDPEFIKSLAALPMKIFGEFVDSKSDQIKRVFLDDALTSPFAADYKNFLFAVDRIVSKYEQTPKVAFTDTIAESSKTSIKRLDSWHASEDYSIDHAYDFVTSLYPPERSYHFKGYEILKKLQFYVFCLDIDSKTVPISKMTLEPFLDGHQVTFIAIKDAYKGKQISQIMYEFAATLGPLYSDTTQTTEARKAWLKLLQSGHDIELVHSSNGEKVDVPLYPDTQAREISSGSDDFPVYGTFDYILKLSKS